MKNSQHAVEYKFILHKVDFEVEKNVAAEFSVTGVLALLFFRSDGTEYFRRFGMRGDENKENVRVFAMLDIMRQREPFGTLFCGLKENNLCERDYLYIRAEAYFKLEKFNRARLFFFLAFIDEIEKKSSSGWHRRIL